MSDPFAPIPLDHNSANPNFREGLQEDRSLTHELLLAAGEGGAPVASQFETEKRAKLGWFFWVCVGWIGLIVLLAVFANLLPLKSPNGTDFLHESTPPSLANWFGRDVNGRDIFSRVIFGSRISLMVGLGATSISFGIGGFIGMIAAYRRGKFDLAVSSLMYTLLAFPALIVVIAVLSFWYPPSLFKIILVLGVAGIPVVYRVIRAATLSAATREYVTAAQIQGATDRRILFMEIFPNILATVVSFYLIGFALTVALEGGLAFLGVSIVDQPSWGNMINEARDGLGYTPSTIWEAFWPSLAFCLFLLSLNFVGDRLRALLDVTEVKL